MKAFEKGFELEPENKDLKNLKDEVEVELRQENLIPADHPEKVKFKEMTDWLNEGGADLGHTKMTYFAKNFRGVTSTREFVEGDTVYYIPLKQMIITENCYATKYGKILYDKNLQDQFFFKTQTFFAMWILQNKNSENSYW